MTPGELAAPAADQAAPFLPWLRQGGVGLHADAGPVLASETLAARLCIQLADSVASGVPAALRIAGFGSGGEAPEQLHRVCAKVRSAFDQAELDTRELSVTVDAGAISPQAAWLIRRSVLGDGALNIVLNAAAVHSASGGAANAFWLQLWHLRSSNVQTALWPTLRSGCALLSAEPAAEVIPGIGVQAPSQSAWIGADVHLPAFVDRSAVLDVVRLGDTLERLVDEAETAHELATWVTPAMQYDAWFNRRLAIHVSGIGDLVKQQALDPEDHATLRYIGSLFAEIRHTLVNRSAALSRTRDRLPSIAATDPCLYLGDKARRSCWQQRWSDAVDRTALRHRNLLIMSPWSIFPHTDADIRYANLAPVLTYADGCNLRRVAPLRGWSARQLMQFHRRVWAVNGLAERNTVVAEQL